MPNRQNHPAIRRSILLIPLLLCAVAAAPAGAAPFTATGDGVQKPVPPHFRVVVVEGLTVDGLRALAPRAAVGLLVPGAGARTNRGYALASLSHGLNLNAAAGATVHGRPLVAVSSAPSPPTRGNTIVVSLPPPGTLGMNDRRYPIAVLGGGFHGLLTSPTTRIPGLVSITDIAPTALGSPHSALGHTASVHPVSTLELLNERIHANNRLKLPVLIIIAGALILLTLVRPSAAVPAILAALLTSLAAGALNAASEPVLVAMVVGGTIGGGMLIARACRDDRRLLAAIVLVLLVHVALLVLRPEWVAITPLGPTQNSRFWGIGNQLETLFVVPVVVGASIAARRYGMAGFLSFALLVLVFITDNRLGSDGGGAIVFGVALAYVGARSLRLGYRGFAILLGLAATVVLAVVMLNLRAPGPEHLRSAFSHGISGLVRVFANRVPLAYLPALDHWPVFVPVAVLFAASFAIAIRASDSRARELVLAAGLAVATSLLVNDSAVYETAAGVAVVAALSRFTIPFAPVPLRAQGRGVLAGRPAASEE